MELTILRLGRLRKREFLTTKYCVRVNQRHFGGIGKRDGRRHSTKGVNGSDENKLSKQVIKC